jgi:SOS response regulatory protein OraA/RecX
MKDENTTTPEKRTEEQFVEYLVERGYDRAIAQDIARSTYAADEALEAALQRNKH